MKDEILWHLLQFCNALRAMIVHDSICFLLLHFLHQNWNDPYSSLHEIICILYLCLKLNLIKMSTAVFKHTIRANLKEALTMNAMSELICSTITCQRRKRPMLICPSQRKLRDIISTPGSTVLPKFESNLNKINQKTTK